MPFILNQSDEDLKKQQQANQNISGSSTILNSANAALSNQTNNAPAAKASGSFTNLQSYLDANKDQAAGMGQKVVDNLDSTANTAKSNIDNFSNGVSSVNKVNQDDLNNNFYNDPTKADKAAYTTLKTGYTGPNDVSKVNGYSDSIDAWNKASQGLKDASTESGRQQLLKNTYDKPGYTAGQNMLDQTLVQNNADSKSAFENVQNKWSGLSSMLDSATSKAGDTIKSNLTNDAANKSLIAQSEQDAQNNLVNPIKQRADAYNASMPAVQADLKSGVNSNSYSQDALDRLGLTANTNLYGANVNDYYKQDLTQANANSMATDTERSRYVALQNLLDGGGMDITASGKQFDPYSIDKAGLDSKIASGKASYDYGYNNYDMSANAPAGSSEMNYLHAAAGYMGGPATPATLQSYLNKYGGGGVYGGYVTAALEKFNNQFHGTDKITKK
jgi:hypothetical protein